MVKDGVLIQMGFVNCLPMYFLQFTYIYCNFLHFLQISAPMYQPQNQKPVKVSNGLGTDAKIDAALHHKLVSVILHLSQQQKLIHIFSQNNEWFSENYTIEMCFYIKLPT